MKLRDMEMLVNIDSIAEDTCLPTDSEHWSKNFPVDAIMWWKFLTHKVMPMT